MHNICKWSYEDAGVSTSVSTKLICTSVESFPSFHWELVDGSPAQHADRSPSPPRILRSPLHPPNPPRIVQRHRRSPPKPPPHSRLYFCKLSGQQQTLQQLLVHLRSTSQYHTTIETIRNNIYRNWIWNLKHGRAQTKWSKHEPQNRS
jgi:hypothetical protein